jgi:hypothetical protein
MLSTINNNNKHCTHQQYQPLKPGMLNHQQQQPLYPLMLMMLMQAAP